jgi:sugar lactone lactonase YvrE
MKPIPLLASASLFALSFFSPASAFELVIGAPKTEAVVTPFCIDFDAAGTLYGVEFENGHRVFKLDASGTFSFLGGQLGVTAPKDNNGKGDGGPIKDALFSGMHDLAVTKAGQVYLADSWVGRLRHYDPSTGIVNTIAGTGKKADTGDGGPADKADINQLFACALSPDESKIYLVDIASRRLRYLDLNTKTIHPFAGNGKKGAPQEGGKALEQPLVNPRAVAVDPNSGVVYIVDRDNHSLLRVDADGSIKTVVNAAGRKGATGDGGPAIDATLNGPKHAIVDLQGRVIIADAENHTIRRYDPQSGKIELLAGTPEKKGNLLSQDRVELNRPHGVRLSRDGKTLYIVDSYNNRVLRHPYE